jgi:hypothetical protein
MTNPTAKESGMTVLALVMVVCDHRDEPKPPTASDNVIPFRTRAQRAELRRNPTGGLPTAS